jgi:hypothetical protein
VITLYEGPSEGRHGHGLPGEASGRRVRRSKPRRDGAYSVGDVVLAAASGGASSLVAALLVVA